MSLTKYESHVIGLFIQPIKTIGYVVEVSQHHSEIFLMADKDDELAQHCIDTKEFVTIQTLDRYVLFHQNVLQHQSDLELPSIIIQKIFNSNFLSIENAKIISHVDSSLYDLIIFADKSVVYTRKRSNFKILPYYVEDDLQLLKTIGMSQEDIDLFVKKLDAHEQIEIFYGNKYDHILQKIIDLTDIPTRLKCRQVSQRWKSFVDNSKSWNSVKLSKHCRYIDRALNYFQKIDIRELDLSELLFEKFEFPNEFSIYSLRSLCISTDYPLELFTSLFQSAPFLQHIKLISSLKFKTNHQLYDCINFVISQCQQRLKCLRRLHIQLRSVSDQIFLQSSSVTSIPISYEVITC